MAAAREALAEARSLMRGWRDEGSRVRDRLLAAQNELNRLVDKFSNRFGEAALPPPAARLADYPAMPMELKAGQTVRPGMVDFARPIVALREQVAELTDEAARIEARQAPVRAKFAELDQLQRRCIEWAGENGVPLPGSDDQHYYATVPAPPPWQSDILGGGRSGAAANMSAPSHAEIMKTAADAEAANAPAPGIFDRLLGRWGG
jgi:hypothetical protein